jgi:hypothetical protein
MLPPLNTAMLGDHPDVIIGRIGHRGERVWEGPQTAVIAIRGNRVGEGFMGPLVIVERPPTGKGDLGTGQIRERAIGEELGGDGAMEAFDLAPGLRVIGATMPDGDAQPQQPGRQRGDPPLATRAPRGAMIGEDGLRQAVALKNRRQLGHDPGLLLVGTGGQAQREAGMVVEDGQGMDPSGFQGAMPHEVHLPQVVRGVMREAHEVAAWGSAGEQPVPTQDGRDGARGRRHHALTRQGMMQLATAPGRVALPQRQHLGLHRRAGAPGRVLRPSRAIGEVGLAAVRARQPPIAGGTADPGLTARLGEGRAVLTHHGDEVLTLRHDRLLLPRHRHTLLSGQRMPHQG